MSNGTSMSSFALMGISDEQETLGEQKTFGEPEIFDGMRLGVWGPLISLTQLQGLGIPFEVKFLLVNRACRFEEGTDLETAKRIIRSLTLPMPSRRVSALAQVQVGGSGLSDVTTRPEHSSTLVC